VPLADFTAMDAMWICLSVFLIIVGLTLAFLLIRLAGSAARLTGLLEGLERSVPPVVDKTGDTLDRVNLQLEKVDVVTTSAVDAASAADTAIRAVSLAVTRPVQKLSGLAKGVSHGTSAFFAGHDFKTALGAGRDAAARREREIAEELAGGVQPRPQEATAAGTTPDSAVETAVEQPPPAGSPSES
jgi:hypothetical protein